MFKRRLTRDFWLQVFIMIQFPLDLWVSHWGHSLFALFLSLRKSRIANRSWAITQFKRANRPALPVINFYLRILYLCEFQIALMVHLGALGKLIREKNLKLKILCQTPFKRRPEHFSHPPRIYLLHVSYTRGPRKRGGAATDNVLFSKRGNAGLKKDIIRLSYLRCFLAHCRNSSNRTAAAAKEICGPNLRYCK